MRKLTVGFFAIIAFLVLAELAVFAHHYQQLKKTQEIESRFFQVESAFHRAIGYGGLIHHFKNYLLRPGENRYYLGAITKADEATQLLDELQLLGKQYVTNVSLTATRAMLREYQRRLEQIKAQDSFGVSARHVDQVVRYDDSPALAELDALSEQLGGALNDAFVLQVQQSLSGSVLIFALSLLAIVLNVRFYVKQLNEANARKVEAFEQKNHELTAINASLQKFAGIVAHELGAPVRNVNGYASVALDDAEKGLANPSNLHRIIECTEKMTNLIERLLSFSREGYRVPVKSRFDLQAVIDDVSRDLLHDQDEDTRVIANKLPVILGDPELLQRVFHNLISNSLKYRAAASPRIHIACRESRSNYQIEVSDNGIGIDAADAEKIFEPLTRLKCNGAYAGRGLGLYLVKAIVSAHGGSIELDTTYSDGARFLICLPKDNPSSSFEAGRGAMIEQPLVQQNLR
jgi:signal transduction histidine kinase